MNDQLKRIKKLYNYRFDGTFLTEEMKVPEEFNKNNFIKDDDQKTVYLGVGIDAENNVEHQIFLGIRFTYVSNYKELVFYFSIVDKNNQFVKGKEAIYDRSVVNEFLPKELQKSIVFFGKLKEMFKILITMETPDKFYMETYEDFVSERLLNPYRNLIPLIMQAGYYVEEEGLSHDKKKYYWKFVKKTKQQLKEDKEFEKFINDPNRKNEEYWKKLTEESIRMFEDAKKRGLFEGYFKNKKINGKTN